MPKHTDANLLKFDQQICFSLYSASNAMVRAYRPALDKLGLTYLQYMVMLILWEQDGITITAIGNKLRLDSGTLTPLLKRLEAKHVLRRQISRHDERVKQIYLTNSGKALKQQALTLPEQILCDIQLPLKDLLALKSQCDTLVQALHEST